MSAPASALIETPTRMMVPGPRSRRAPQHPEEHEGDRRGASEGGERDPPLIRAGEAECDASDRADGGARRNARDAWLGERVAVESLA